MPQLQQYATTAKKLAIGDIGQRNPATYKCDLISPEVLTMMDDNRIYLKFLVNSKEFIGLLDTGANFSVIGNNFHANFANSVQLKRTYVSARTADGSAVYILGSMTLPVFFEGNQKQFDFLVMPNIKTNIILGMDFMSVYGLLNIFNITKGSIVNNSQTRALDQQELNEVKAVISRDELNPQQKKEISMIIEKFKDISTEKVGLGKTSLVKHRIVTKGPPIKQRYYPLSPVKLKALNEEVDRMLALGVIEPSRSPWANPVVMATKKDGTLRFCLDARKLNDVTVKDSYPIPYISSILDNLRGARYLTSLDLSSAFWQIELDDTDGITPGCPNSSLGVDTSNSRQKCSFIVQNRGSFQFNRVPFGLSNAGAEMQRLVDRLFSHQFGEKVFTFLDDLLIATEDFSLHVEILNKVWLALKEAGLTINLDKCHFCRSELKYLGFIIDAKGLRTDPNKLDCIEKFPRPTSAKQLRGFIGLCSYYRRFVNNFSTIIAPMTALIGKRKGKEVIEWNADAEKSFTELKRAMLSAPVLACPDFNKPFVLHCDASSVGIGSVLTQEFEGKEHPVAYHSRLLSRTEKNYSTTERELLAVVDSINHFRPYLDGFKFTVVTDHMSLKWLKSLNNPSGRLARWAMQISQYNFEICHRKGTQHIVPDFLSRIEVNLISYSAGAGNSTDPWYNKIYNGCKNQPHKYKNFYLDGDILYRYSKPKNDLDRNHWKIVIPYELINDCIKEAHEGIDSVHPGVYKTYHKLKLLYYWPNMHKNVVAFLEGCDICKAYKHSNKAPQGLMKNQKIVSYPMHTLSIDIIGPLPKSNSGHIYILSIVDIFTKFCWIHPLRTATAKTITSFIESEIIFKHGTPCIIICDNATVFRSKEFKNFVDKFSIPKIFYNAFYTPQSNTVERYNQTVETCLAILVGQDQRSWSRHLPRIQLALNSSINVATGFTPYFLATGREILIDGKLHSLNSKLPNDLNDLDVADRTSSATALDEMSKIFIRVQNALTEAYKQNALRYNTRRKHVAFSTGDIVWRKNFVQSNAANFFSSKLAPRFVKCKVLEKISNNVYILGDIETPNKGKYHVKDIVKVGKL